MARKKRTPKTKTKLKKKPAKRIAPLLVSGLVLFVLTAGFGASQYVRASSDADTPVALDIDPNFSLKNRVIDFFEANNASAMIPIIKCESRFRHYTEDGSILMNTSGSSATGIAQILASKHPDPKIIKRYNRKFDMDLTVDDFDITTFEGNIGYALVLFKVRGTRDWECANKFRF